MSTAPKPPKLGMFGERLRRERELRGVKLEEIAESTKISKRNLLALEEEQFDQLPGGIFNKGFVRAYAKYLGLDEEQAVNDFLAASANYDQPAALQPPPTSWVRPPVIPSEATTARRRRLWTFVAALVLVAGLGLWFQYEHRFASPFLPALSIARTAPRSETQAGTSSANGSSAPMQTLPIREGTNVGGVPIPEGATIGTVPIPKGATIGGAAQKTSSAIRVAVHATGSTWVSATADGAPILDVTLAPGESRELNANQTLVLKVGNAAALDVTFNGKPLPALGEENQVKTLTFTPNGAR